MRRVGGLLLVERIQLAGLAMILRVDFFDQRVGEDARLVLAPAGLGARITAARLQTYHVQVVEFVAAGHTAWLVQVGRVAAAQLKHFFARR